MGYLPTGAIVLAIISLGVEPGWGRITLAAMAAIQVAVMVVKAPPDRVDDQVPGGQR